MHLVRSPMATVTLRMARAKARPHSLRLHQKLWLWEKVQHDSLPVGNDTVIASIILRHWVHKNSFVLKHTQRCFTIEDLASDPLHTWMLCLDVERDDCPALGDIRPVLRSMDHKKNTNGKLEGG